MDSKTLQLYDSRASEYAACYRDIQPSRIYDLIRTFFHPNEPTVDIGFGSGRDVSWLNEQGFPCVGYDAAPGMVREAQSVYPNLQFHQDALSDLATIPPSSYANVLCCAVWMHLRREDFITAALSLVRVLSPRGRVVLSYRQARAETGRESDGRLFTTIHPGKLRLLLESVGLRILHASSEPDRSRPGITWHTIVAEKNLNVSDRGLDRVQGILAQDRKTATYKFALIRALCAISRTQPHLAEWKGDTVYVPLWSIAVQWLRYYWPLFTAPRLIVQMNGEAGTNRNPIAFRQPLSTLTGGTNLHMVLAEIESEPQRHASVLQVIAETIRKGPVQYSGTRATPVFSFVRDLPATSSGMEIVASRGWVGVPEAIWADICRFNHWIEDSVVVRWAQLTVEMNPHMTVGAVLPLLLLPATDERETQEVAGLLRSSDRELVCVWTGKLLPEGFHVDHVIPYSVWGNNDLWNLLPCLEAVNTRKSDRLPSPDLISRRAESIIEYWRLYQEHRLRRFDFEVACALGCDPSGSEWERQALAGLKETVQRLTMSRGLRQWEP